MSKRLQEQIDEIFNKYTTIVWVNPYYPKRYIPDENISLIKKEILDLLKNKNKIK